MEDTYRPGRAWRHKRQFEARAKNGPAEEMSGRHIARRLGGFARPHWRPVVFALLMLVGETLMTLAKPWPVKFVLDNIITQPNLQGKTLDHLAGVMLLVIVIAVFTGLFTYLQARAINRAGRTIVFELRAALFDQIQRLSLQYHSRRQTGDLMARVTSPAGRALMG